MSDNQRHGVTRMNRVESPRLQRFIAALVCLLLLGASASPAQAQRERGERPRFAPDAEVREAFEPVIREARASVAVMMADGEQRAFGTIVDAEGYIVSKASELVGRRDIQAYLPDGRKLAAAIVGMDRLNDLVMLKIDADRLTAAKLADREPALGRWVVCAGADKSPIAVGIVSSKPRPIKPPQLVLGVILREQPGQGLRVMGLSEGFGADEAGMRRGDIVTQIEGKKVFAVQQLIDRLQGQAVGDEVDVTLLRGDERMSVSVRLSEMRPDPDSRSERMNRMGGAISERRSGFERVIQHDAELRPEQCGGPVVNLKGEVIAVNIARAGRIETYALPASLVRDKLAQLKRGGQGDPNSGEDADAGEPVTAK
jgi:serine protease Do